jgi:Ca2+-binding EF-hand superfamily protein
MQYLTEQQVNELHSLFNSICKSDDGTLGVKEVAQVLKGIGLKITAGELREIVADVVGEESLVNFDAFVVLMTRKYKHLYLEEEGDVLFSEVDGNKDGTIDSTDIIALMSKRGISVTKSEAENILGSLTTHGNTFDLESFKAFVHDRL